jgi:HPt (histidine-containing phosphotransfer) domain-containing protein
MKGDGEKCLAAGMDAYLAKPVKRKTLEAVLTTLFEHDEFPVAEVPKDPTASGYDSPIVDLPCLSETASSPEKLRHIIEIYLRHTETRLEALRIAVEQKSCSEIYEIAHQCLGSSRTCGMTAILPALSELQRMGKAGDLAGAGVQFDAAWAAFQQLKPFLQVYLEQLPKNGKGINV